MFDSDSGGVYVYVTNGDRSAVTDGIIGDIEDFEGRVSRENIEECCHAICCEFIPF